MKTTMDEQRIYTTWLAGAAILTLVATFIGAMGIHGIKLCAMTRLGLPMSGVSVFLASLYDLVGWCISQ